MRFEGKVAVITGGGSGIGLATVRRFAAEGGSVVAMDRDGMSLQAALEGVERATPLRR